MSEMNMIVVDAERVITVPDELKQIGVQGDHNIETITFECPRYWDEPENKHDLSAMSIYINYMRPDGEIGRTLAKLIDDKLTEEKMYFEWVVSQHTTEINGSITFLVHIEKIEQKLEDGKPVYDADGQPVYNLVRAWNSKSNSELFVTEGIDANTQLEEINADVIETILQRMKQLESIGLSHVIGVEEIDHGYKVTMTDSTCIDEPKVIEIKHGATFFPEIDADGYLSWSNDNYLDNPEKVKVKGATFIPSVSPEGDLSWRNDSGLENPETVNVKGTTFIPSVSSEGDLSWSNNSGLKNPETINIKGNRGPSGGIFQKHTIVDDAVSGLDMFGKYRIKRKNDYEVSHETVDWDSEFIYGVTAASTGSNIYLFGGANSDGETTDSIRVFDTETNTITTLDVKLPEPSAYLHACVLGSAIYLYNTTANKAYVFESAINTLDICDNECIYTFTGQLYDPNKIVHIGNKMYSYLSYGGANGYTTNKLISSDITGDEFGTFEIESDLNVDGPENILIQPDVRAIIAPFNNGFIYFFIPNSDKAVYYDTINKTFNCVTLSMPIAIDDSIDSLSNGYYNQIKAYTIQHHIYILSDNIPVIYEFTPSTGDIRTIPLNPDVGGKYSGAVVGTNLYLFGDTLGEVNTNQITKIRTSASEPTIVIGNNYSSLSVSELEFHNYTGYMDFEIVDFVFEHYVDQIINCRVIYKVNDEQKEILLINVTPDDLLSNTLTIEYAAEVLQYNYYLEDATDSTESTVEVDPSLSISGQAADAKAVGDALNEKADKTDLDNYYDKTQTDEALNSKADKEALDSKADKTDLDNYLTKDTYEQEIIDKVSYEDLENNYYDKTQTDEALDGKANKVENTNESLDAVYTSLKNNGGQSSMLIMGANPKAGVLAKYDANGNLQTYDAKNNYACINLKQLNLATDETKAMIDENKDQLDLIKKVLFQGDIMAETEVSQGYSKRLTANGEFVVDNQETLVSRIQGVSVAVSGNNLVDFTAQTIEIEGTSDSDGIEITVEADGTVTALGYKLDNTTTVNQQIGTFVAPKAGDYCLSYVVDKYADDGNCFITLGDGNIAPNNTFTFTAEEGQSIPIHLEAYVGREEGVYTNYSVRIMINEGTEALPYEEPINTIKNSYFKGIESYGSYDGNLFDISKITGLKDTGGSNKSSFVAITDGKINVKYGMYSAGVYLTGNELYFKAGKYTVSLDVDMNSTSGTVYMGLFNPRTSTYIHAKTTGLAEQTTYHLSKTIEVSEDGIYYFSMEGGGTSGTSTKLDIEFYNVCVEQGELEYGEVEPDTSFMLDTPVELGQFDYIDVVNQKLVKQTAIAEITTDTGFTEEEILAAFGEEYVATRNGRTIAYRSDTPTETPIELPEGYVAYITGTEKCIQGDIDNSEFGANPIITQTYFIVLGGNK